jgi:hypothetical protein
MTVQATGQPLRLPGGAQLAPGETPLVGERFMFSMLAFYLHTELTLTNRRLYATQPNTFLWLIPTGTTRSGFPIENIAGVSAGSRFLVLKFLGGLASVVVGLYLLAVPGGLPTIPGGGLIWLIVALGGLSAILTSPKQAIEVMNSGGGVIRFPVSVFERGRTVEFANRVSDALAGRTHGVQATAAPAAHDAGAITAEALRHLQGLRDQGLVTESEYAAKRSEILARI